MAFTSKHFVRVASLLASERAFAKNRRLASDGDIEVIFARLTYEFAVMFREANPRFDTSRFIDASERST